MTNSLKRAGAFTLIVVFCGTLFPVSPAEASHRSSRNTEEATSTTATDYSSYSGRRDISSATQKEIDKLDEDIVEDLPIPVLLGVSLSDISPNFGDPRDGGARTHEGEDIMAPLGDYIVSPTDAVVIAKGTGDSAGNYISTANPGGETFIYMHLDAFADDIKVGTVLEKGDLIGYVGDTGSAKGSGTHLHFEIRQNRTPTDPYPRLTEVFTLEERIDAVAKALKNADDEDEDARMLVANYRSTFVSAKAKGIELPDAIEDLLDGNTSATIVSSTFTRDLTLGSRGDDVTALQNFLIKKGAGAKATALEEAGATGYFGALTQKALAEYQSSNSISPAAGYFGPLTRARVAG